MQCGTVGYGLQPTELDEGMQFGTIWEVPGCSTLWHAPQPVPSFACSHVLHERHAVWHSWVWFAAICKELMLWHSLGGPRLFQAMVCSSTSSKLCLFTWSCMRGMQCGTVGYGLQPTELDEGMQFGTIWEVPGCSRLWHAPQPLPSFACSHVLHERHAVWHSWVWFAARRSWMRGCSLAQSGRSKVVPRYGMLLNQFQALLVHMVLRERHAVWHSWVWFAARRSWMRGCSLAQSGKSKVVPRYGMLFNQFQALLVHMVSDERHAVWHSWALIAAVCKK